MNEFRYVSRRRARADYDEEFDIWCDQVAAQTSITVFEPEDEGIETGLLDATGNDLIRVVSRSPMGFRCK